LSRRCIYPAILLHIVQLHSSIPLLSRLTTSQAVYRDSVAMHNFTLVGSILPYICRCDRINPTLVLIYVRCPYPILSYPIWRKTIALWGNWTGSYNDCKSCNHHLPLSYCAIIQIQSGTNMQALRFYIRYELWVCSYWLNCKFQSLTAWWLGELTLANILAFYNSR